MVGPLVQYSILTYPGYVNMTLGSGKIGDVTHMLYILRDPPPKRGRPFALPCQAFCGVNLHRVHISCFTCPLRLIRAGKSPTFFPVTVKWLMVYPHRTRAGIIRARMLKLVLSIMGMLALG